MFTRLNQMLYPSSANPKFMPSDPWSFICFHVLHTVLLVFHLAYSLVHFVQYVAHRIKIRGLAISYHHNRTPQLISHDVADLTKLPNHLAVIVDLQDGSEEGGGVEGLVAQISEIAAWCCGTGEIKQLSVYERTGCLKSYNIKDVYKLVEEGMRSYYGSEMPSIKIDVPHSGAAHPTGESNGKVVNRKADNKNDLTIHLLSEEDGRECLVDLTKTLSELAIAKKLKPRDITVDVIDEQMNMLVVTEPELLIVFGPQLDLQGFPPWQIRLTEIYHQPDNDAVTYGVFLKALQSFASCKQNVGK
ncbi:YALIA101S03e12024g1_1 [Yarrowia lipolytica]|nr:Dehydrodolichyl diphosphate synthase complex subunit NUS1 [Yarrowia lipolytica]SEI33178.1 YALIA101S03e12024g1_1 [Yarrowia lipolytica]